MIFAHGPSEQTYRYEECQHSRSVIAFASRLSIFVSCDGATTTAYLSVQKLHSCSGVIFGKTRNDKDETDGAL